MYFTGWHLSSAIVQSALGSHMYFTCDEGAFLVSCLQFFYMFHNKINLCRMSFAFKSLRIWQTWPALKNFTLDPKAIMTNPIPPPYHSTAILSMQFYNKSWSAHRGLSFIFILDHVKELKTRKQKCSFVACKIHMSTPKAGCTIAEDKSQPVKYIWEEWDCKRTKTSCNGRPYEPAL